MIIVIVLAGFIFIGSAYSADIDVQSVDDNLTQTNQENINEFTEDSSILTDDISRNGALSAISDENDKVNDLKAGEITVYDEDQLQKAVDNESISYIKIGITIYLTKQIVILRDSVTIKGLDWDFHVAATTFYRTNKLTQPDNGGAILWKGANGRLIDCVFYGFSATNYGGAIYSDYGLNLTHCEFAYCVAGQGGGAISLYKGSTVLNDCFFLRCNVSYFGYDAGEAIDVTLGNLEVYNSHFENCSAEYSGGAIKMRSGSIVGCTFVLCSADVSGAITADNALIRNCTFDKNSARDGGALGFTRDSQNEVIDCIFKNNYARTTDNSIGTGGAISLASLYCNITNCSFMNNSADMGDSIYLYPVKSSSLSIFISNCNFFDYNNKDIIYMEPGYSVYFNNNDLKSGYILNNGSSIKSSTLLGGESKTVTPSSTVDMAANLFDDTGLNGKLNPIIDISDNKIYLTLDDESYQGTFKNNEYIFTIDTKDIPCGEYKLGAKSNMYPNLKSNMTLTICSIHVPIKVNIPDINYGSSIEGSFNFTGHTGNATLIINGTEYNTTFDNNGKFVVNTVLPICDYNVDFNFVTYDSTYEGSATTKFTIYNASGSFIVHVSNITYGNGFTINVNDAKGE